MRNPSSIDNPTEMCVVPDRIRVAMATAKDADGTPPRLRLALACARYAMSLGVQLVLLCMWVGPHLVAPGVFAALWLLQGVWLDRNVRRLANVERGNALTAVALVAWPIYYGSLLGRRLLAKHS